VSLVAASRWRDGVIARSRATKQSRGKCRNGGAFAPGLLRFARNDGALCAPYPPLYPCPKNLMFENLSPVLRAPVSSRHPRPHEGLSRVVLKVRAGSGACGRGLPSSGLGRLLQTGVLPRPVSGQTCLPGRGQAPSCPPVRQYDRSAPRGLKRAQVASSQTRPPKMRDAGDRNRRTRTPGDRFFIVRNGRSAPVSSLFIARAGVRQR
jgi:hypothetical protein